MASPVTSLQEILPLIVMIRLPQVACEWQTLNFNPDQGIAPCNLQRRFLTEPHIALSSMESRKQKNNERHEDAD